MMCRSAKKSFCAMFSFSLFFSFSFKILVYELVVEFLINSFST